MGSLCQVPKIMYTISYAFNITLLIIIIAKDYLSGFISMYVCFQLVVTNIDNDSQIGI